MKVERTGDLVYLTYYMVNWKDERQTLSSQRCSNCGREMSRIEALVGDSIVGYDGLVCHECKRVTWVKRG